MGRRKFILGLTFFFVAISLFAMSNNKNIKSDLVLNNGTRVVEYIPEGVCARLISIEVSKENIIEKVTFQGGCSGNAKGIGALIRGMKVEEAAKRLKGIKCGNKTTSCPDQLANALEYILKNK
jgi:uncharacterized protein TIGR03905